MWEKARFTGQAGIRKTSVVAVDVSKQVGWHRNRGRWIVPGRAWRVPVYRPGGVRHGGDVSLVCGSCAEREKAAKSSTPPLDWPAHDADRSCTCPLTGPGRDTGSGCGTTRLDTAHQSRSDPDNPPDTALPTGCRGQIVI